MADRRFDAVLFDLLTALLDSWTLWNSIAGSKENGQNWRTAYLRRTYETGAYRPYETLVAEAATEVGLSPMLASDLALRYGELKPWPEVGEVLGALRSSGRALGVVTNCSEELGARAVACTGIEFDVAVTAERIGYYKPDPRPYTVALTELGVAPSPLPVRGRLRVRSVRHRQPRSAHLLARPCRHDAASRRANPHRTSSLAIPAVGRRTRRADATSAGGGACQLDHEVWHSEADLSGAERVHQAALSGCGRRRHFRSAGGSPRTWPPCNR